MAVNRVTSQDVADRAGVSRTTVSLVLNNVPGIQISDTTRQRVLQAAEELNYVPDAAAQALASRQSQVIGLVLIRTPDQIASDIFLTQTLDGLIKSVHKAGMRLLIDIIDPEHQEETYLHLMRAKRIDGIILSGPRSNDESLNALLDVDFPTVLLGQLPGSQFYSVDVDNRAAAHNAATHLLNLGHRRIACITNAPLSYTAANDRLSGYRQALETAGVPFDPPLVRFAEFDPESGYEQMNNLLESGSDFSAAFVASDLVAYGAIAATREHGLRIPGGHGSGRFGRSAFLALHQPAAHHDPAACHRTGAYSNGSVIPPPTRRAARTEANHLGHRTSGARFLRRQITRIRAAPIDQ
ncbi:MAG: LacI family transcriptional regulator [Anaerolineales bacterium]|nr:LacI family transcriptional regulator [Anaerolineales bacterium]